MKVFSVDVHTPIGMSERGLYTRVTSGVRTVVNGRAMVDTDYGVIVADTARFCETLEEAKVRASEEIEGIAACLMRQAKALREEAEARLESGGR